MKTKKKSVINNDIIIIGEKQQLVEMDNAVISVAKDKTNQKLNMVNRYQSKRRKPLGEFDKLQRAIVIVNGVGYMEEQ